jgi:hypothetical protein
MSGNNSTNHFYQNIHAQQNFDRVLLNVYIDMYNTTLREIDRLYDNLDDIRNAIRTLDVNHRSMNLSANTNRNNSNNHNRNNRRTPHNDRSSPNRIYLNGRYYTIEYIRPDARVETNRRQPNNANNNILGNAFLNEIVRNFYEPVLVRPTSQEIQSATLNTTFGTIINPINNSCPISLERFERNTDVSQIIHCGHIFNPADLNMWFQTNVKCPVCRYDIRRYNRRGMSTPPPHSNQEIPPVNIDDNSENPLLNNPDISNIQYNENGDITFDVSGNSFANLATQALTDLLRNNNTRNQTINNLFDPSGNAILLFETFLRRGL